MFQASTFAHAHHAGSCMFHAEAFVREFAAKQRSGARLTRNCFDFTHLHVHSSDNSVDFSVFIGALLIANFKSLAQLKEILNSFRANVREQLNNNGFLNGAALHLVVSNFKSQLRVLSVIFLSINFLVTSLFSDLLVFSETLSIFLIEIVQRPLHEILTIPDVLIVVRQVNQRRFFVLIENTFVGVRSLFEVLLPLSFEKLSDDR